MGLVACPSLLIFICSFLDFVVEFLVISKTGRKSREKEKKDQVGFRGVGWQTKRVAFCDLCDFTVFIRSICSYYFCGLGFLVYFFVYHLFFLLSFLSFRVLISLTRDFLCCFGSPYGNLGVTS